MREERLVAIQRRQHNLFTLDQAVRGGFTRSAIRTGVRHGRWRRVLKAVFADAASPPSPEQEALAACLACGVGAVASHLSAAVVWKLEAPAPVLPAVTVAPGRQPVLAGVDVRRTNRLARADVTHVGVVPVTSPNRTLTDLAGVLPQRELAHALDAFRRRRLVDPERLVAFLDEPWALNQPGSDVLRRLARARIASRPTDSGLETDFLLVVQDARLPVPVAQHPIPTPTKLRHADFAYVDERVAIELDGFEWRSDNPDEFEEWHERQNAIEQAGWRFRRFTRRQVLGDPLYVVYSLSAALGLWPSRWRRLR